MSKEALSVKQPCCVEDTLKMALEALEEAHYKIEHKQDAKKREQTITAIKAALEAHKALMSVPDGEQPAVTESHKQEPVACVAEVSTYDGYLRKEVVWNKRIDSFSLGTRFYTIPPYVPTERQRTWVGLTEDERTHIREGVATYHDITDWNYAIRVQQATELKLKEKNT